MPSNYFDQYDEPEAQQAPPAVASNYFDQYDEPETQPEPPKQFNLQAERASFPTVFDQEIAPTPPADIAWHNSEPGPASPLQGMADFMAPAMDGAERLLSPLGFSWDNAQQAVDEMQQLPFEEQNLAPLIGGASGALDLGDALLNAPAGAIQQAMGVAPEQRWRSDMQGAFNAQPEVAKRMQQSPHQFNVAQGIGSVAAPMPMMGPAGIIGGGFATAVKAGKPLAVLGNIAASGAITGGLLGAGQAVKQNQQITPRNVIPPAVAGGLFGGLAGGAAVGASKLAKVLGKVSVATKKEAQAQVKQASQAAAKETMQQFNKLPPKEKAQMLQGRIEADAQQAQQAAQQAKAKQLMESLGIQDPESRAAVDAMSPGVVPSVQPQSMAPPQPAAPPLVPPAVAQASTRKSLSPEFYGRKKNLLAADASEFPADVRSVVEEIAVRKSYKDHDEAVFKHALEAAWKKFVPKELQEAAEFDLAGFKLKRSKIFPKPKVRTQQQLNSARELLTDGVQPDSGKRHFAATTTQKFGEDTHADFAALPESAEGAAAKLHELEGYAAASKKTYDNVKAEKLGEEIEKLKAKITKAEAGAKPDKNKIQQMKLDLLQLEGEEDFAKFAEEVIARTEQERGEFHVKTQVPHPAGEQHGMVEVAVEYKHGAMRQTMPEENKPIWKAQREEILAADPRHVPKASFSGAAKAGGVVAALVASLSHQSANAAEIGAKLATDPSMLAVWNQLPGNELILAAAVLKAKLPQKLATKILEHETATLEIPFTGGKKIPTGIPVSAWWNDTMDNITYADRVLGGESLTKAVWERLGKAMQATWGVKISPEAREAALGALREGHVTLEEAATGALNPKFEASPEALEAVEQFSKLTDVQRNAVVMYRVVQKDIARLVQERHKLLNEWIEQNPTAENMPAVHQAKVSMEYMMRSLGKRSEATHGIDKILSKGVSNWMDFQFFWNPDHHLTNLTDMFIAGSGRVGLKNVVRANKLLLGNAELKTAFKNSNLTGGYRADQAEVGQIVGKKSKIWTEHDIQSDLVNADRTFLAHALQYFQRHESDIRATGFKGTDEDFAKALVKDDGSLQPEVVMDAWAKSAETLSRTLGVDIYRINSNILSMAPVSRSLGIFVRQPARLSRLAMNYMAEGNFKALYTTLGITLAIGGAAAIPSDLKFLGEYTSPDSYFKVAALADELDLFYKATGYKLSPKITWSFLWLTMAAGNPITDAMNGPAGIVEGIGKGDWEKVIKGLERTVPYVAPRWLGAPAGTAVRAGEGIKQGFFDKEEKAYVERFFKLQFSETGTRKLDNVTDQIRHALSPLMPGKSAWAEGYKASKDEQHYSRENLAQGGLKLFGLGGLAPAPRPVADQFFRKSASPIDPTTTGYEDRYNAPDFLLSPFRNR